VSIKQCIGFKCTQVAKYDSLLCKECLAKHHEACEKARKAAENE